MICLWCDEEIIIETTWRNLFLPSAEQRLCSPCSNQLNMLWGSRCERCSRSTQKRICPDCIEWQNRKEDPLISNYSVYAYNDRMQEMIAKWKYRGDYILGEAFQKAFTSSFQKKFKDKKNYAIVPIPLSEERINERAFNQADMLAGFLTSNPTQILTRIHGEKQSKKTRRERIQARNPFEITETLNKPAILVDDIYTTGTTLRFAADVLKQSGCPEVYGYTLIRG